MDRRKGTTIFWEYFWKIIHGERRKEPDRRRTKAECIVQSRPSLLRWQTNQERVTTMKKSIFVFGSNLRGVHGAGAAKFALEEHGAQWGIGVGRTGNSYAIPTKDWLIRTLPLTEIAPYVERFIDYAKAHPELTFQVTRIGCGLAGYTPADIAPMFKGVPDNCIMPEDFKPWL